MSQPREATTDKLINVINVIQLGRKTGLLTVERGQGKTYEEGFIVFQQGQITQAKAGKRQGKEALAWLKTWEACRFSFDQNAAPQFSVPATPPPDSRTEDFDTPTPSHKESNPLRERKTTGNLGPAQTPTPAPLIPIRARKTKDAIQLIEEMKLSRTHKQLFLLIDDQRTLVDLARLMRRGGQEIFKLLHDLEQLGLIRF